MRAATLHRKAVELANDMADSEPKGSYLVNSAGHVGDSAAELVTQIAKLRAVQ